MKLRELVNLLDSFTTQNNLDANVTIRIVNYNDNGEPTHDDTYDLADVEFSENEIVLSNVEE